MIHGAIKANDVTTVCRRLQRTLAVAVKSRLIPHLVKAESHKTGLTGRAAVYLARPVVFGLRGDFHRGVAPGALACGGDGCDAEPVARAAG